VRHVHELNEENPMQYVLLIYQGTTPLPNTPEWDTLPKDEQKAIYADYAALNQDPRITSGPPLGLPENARTVRVDNGTTLTTDGPYVDTKGAVGGFAVLEADSIDEAIDLAARIPAARHGGAIEIRPVGTYW
jgi:hypothetical protein